ncbi:MAG TPA: 16S rRNA (uracil(1498)-N(3))-methyltransferase [Gammaproteobacteria bacterium]|nr:16S rRNA (uracil(1498)-N(3))-methyltransferase [Gammaproteobacteria bacterium]
MRSTQRSVRIFLDSSPTDGQLALAPEEAHYLATVLRLRAGDAVTAFNGRGMEWSTRVTGLTRRAGLLEVLETLPPLAESALDLTLAQAVVKSEAMDTIIQKATELGVTRIAPIITQYCVVRLDEQRIDKRLAHWRRISRSACEQSGRHLAPEILAPTPLRDFLSRGDAHRLRIMLDPRAHATAAAALPQSASALDVIVGPEGGFGPRDEAEFDEYPVRRLRCGPRVLRADTAAIAICALAQERWGDLTDGR